MALESYGSLIFEYVDSIDIVQDKTPKSHAISSMMDSTLLESNTLRADKLSSFVRAGGIATARRAVVESTLFMGRNVKCSSTMGKTHMVDKSSINKCVPRSMWWSIIQLTG